MATLTIQGRTVTVSDDFLKLSPEQQDATVEEIAQSMGATAAPPKSVGGFIQNIGSDAYGTAKGIGESVYAGGKKLVTDPVGAARDVYDAANTAGVTAVGGIENAYNMAAPQNMQIARRPEMEMASQVGAHLKDKYWDNLGDTVYNHPVQTAMDASSLLYGGEGAAARVLGEGAMATKALGKAAELTNPLNAVAKPAEWAVNGLGKSSALREMRANAPTEAQMVAQKNALYSTLDNAGIKFDANEYGQMMHRIADKLKTYRAGRAPLTRDLAENNMMNFYGKSPSFRDVEDMLIEAKSILRIPDNAGPTVATDKAAAHVVLDELSPFFDKAPLITNGRIPADQVAPLAKQARDLGRRNIINRELSEIERKSKWYVSGGESGLRNQIASFGKRQGAGGKSFLTDLEQKMGQQAVRREGAHGLLNTLGSKLVQAGLAAAGVSGGIGLVPMAAALGTSTAAGALSAMATNRKVDQLRKTILAGREAQTQALLGAKRIPVKTKGLLLGSEGVGLLGGHRAP